MSLGERPIARSSPGSVALVCGEQIDGDLRMSLARTMRDTRHVRDGGAEADLVVVDGLCAHPQRVEVFCQRHRPAAVVVIGCDVWGAAAGMAAAVDGGVDTAHATMLSLSPALSTVGGMERGALVAATCQAGVRRAGLLAHEPLAARVPWRRGQPIDRRSLLGPWRGFRSRSAHIDAEACLGADRCKRCRTDCPVGAIDVDSGDVHVDPVVCVSCGLCVTTCPTQAMSMPGADLAGLTAEVDTLLRAGVTDIELLCERYATWSGRTVTRAGRAVEAEVILPCTALLTIGMALGLVGQGARLRVQSCPDCRCSGAVRANAGFFQRLVGGGWSTPRVAGAREIGLIWREPAATNAGIAELGLGGAIGVGIEAQIMDDGAPTRVVKVDPARCTWCGSCALACPTSALAFDPATATLTVDSSACVGCGGCSAACPEMAVVVERGADVRAIVTGPMVLPSPSRTQVCDRCGSSVAIDPSVAAVQRRLAAQGRPAALIANLRRCPACAGSAARAGSDGPWTMAGLERRESRVRAPGHVKPAERRS